MENALYFALKKTVYTRQTRVALQDICTVYTDADTTRLSGVYFDIAPPAAKVTAIELISRLDALYPSVKIISIGEPSCSVFARLPRQGKAAVALKLVFIGLTLFFGGAIAIMTFHEDVGMRGVHSGIYAFFTGVQQSSVPAVSIPYSIGIAIGFSVLYGLFRRRKSRPTMLDVDVFKHESTVRAYMTEKRGDGDD